MRFLALLAVVGGLWAAPTVAWACSVTSDFVRSSTYEMVDQADAVVVATAVGESEDGDGLGSVRFRVDQALKGRPPTEFLGGWTTLGEAIPSDPESISEPHPEGFAGPCVRMTFQQGGQYVLFLQDDPEYGWRMVRHIFWRDAEDYAGPDSPWVEALRFYIDVEEAHPDPDAALAALAQELGQLESPSASSRDRALAADIRDHLSSLSPWKPTGYLIAAYEALERGESPSFPVRGPEANRESGPAQALTDFIFDVEHPDFDVEEQKIEILRSLANGDHPAASGLFERIVAGAPTARQLGMALRFYSNNGQVRRAYDLIETEGLRRLGGLPDRDARALASDMIRSMRGPYRNYNDADEAWREDPYVAARWPETALSLSWDLRRRFGEGFLDTAIESLRPSDYRARPEVTLTLASAFDEDVVEWAIRETDRLAPQADWLDDEDPTWAPLAALVVAFGDDRDAALVRAWCSGEAGRIMVVQSLAQWGDDMDQGLLKTFLVTPGQDEEALNQLRLAILTVTLSSGRDDFRWTDQGYEAVQASLTGGVVEDYVTDVRPVSCPVQSQSAEGPA